jgi:hypothetical protein
LIAPWTTLLQIFSASAESQAVWLKIVYSHVTLMALTDKVDAAARPW